MVNEAGNWIGKIIGGSQGVNYGGSDGTQFVVNPDGSITAYNSGNGSDSTNSTQVTQSTQNNTTQTNTANVTNNLNLSANTGNNTIKDNMGGDASITTGDANIVASVVNFINNNIVGGHVYVTVVNVFGSWLGNFVGPGHTKEESLAQTEEVGRGGGSVNQDQNSNQGSGDANNSSSDSSQDSQVAVNDINTNPAIKKLKASAPTPSFTNGDSVLANATLDDKLAMAGSLDVSSKNENAININLAWAVLAVPPMLGLVIARRRSRLSVLPARRKDEI